MLPSISILFVEDSGIEKNKILDALKKHYTIEAHELASETNKFRDLFTSKPWDLIISEEYLRNTDIFEILDIVNASGLDVPVFVFSAYSDVKGAVESIRRGAVDFCTKDDINGLIKSINTYCQNVGSKKHIGGEFDEQMLFDLIEQSTDLVFLIDAKTFKFRYVNRAVLEKTEYSFGELRSMTPADLVSNLSYETLKEKLTDASEDQQKKIVIFTEIVSKSGKVHQSEATLQLVYRKNESLFFARVEDLSEKIRSRENALRMMQIVEYSSSGIFVVEKDGTITYANPKILKQTGFSEKEIITKNIRDIKNVIEESGEYEKIWSTVFSGRRWAGKTKSLDKNGEVKEVLSFVSPIRNTKDVVVSLAFFDEDATLANEMKMQLLHAQKMETLGELAGGIAHDFNNVLTAMGGFASVISRKLKDREDVSHMADKLVEFAESGRTLTQGLLCYSRKQEHDFRVCDVDAIIRKITDIISLVFPEDITIKVQAETSGLRIKAIESQLEQILMNLTNNAKDAMPDGGTLSIISSKSFLGDRVSIKVIDTGTGMSADVLANIFKPFFTTKSEGRGTGLGLAIVKDLVEVHKGFISCESVEGKGTTFTIEFPTVDIDEISGAATTSDSLVDIDGHIIVVDDNPGVREGMETMLDEFGYKSAVFDSFEALYEKIDQYEKIPLAIIDMVLFDTFSHNMVEELEKKYSGITIIYMTGYDEETLKNKKIDTGEKIILRKPIFAHSLLKVIAEAVKKK